MTMNIGDIVMTPKGVARVIDFGAHDPIIRVNRGGPYHPASLHLLTVAEAFEIAGHAVPEGAKIYWVNYEGLEWWGWRTDTHFGDTPFVQDGPGSPLGWHVSVRASWDNSYEECIDLRRTPASDTWDALPQVVREKVEEALNG